VLNRALFNTIGKTLTASRREVRTFRRVETPELWGEVDIDGMEAYDAQRSWL